MDTVAKRLYECLFLIDSAEATADWEGINASIEKVLTRNGAEVVSIRKWEERKLAYEVAKVNRGTYLLAYFNSAPSQIASIERDVQLSERIMRVMILRTDGMSAEDIDRDTPVMVVEKKVSEAEAAAKQAAEADTGESPQPQNTTEEPGLQKEPELSEAPLEESTEDKT